MNERLEAALLYRGLGLFVIPLAPHSKVIGFELLDQIGFDRHPTDRASITQIEHWFDVEPDLNIGIRMAGSGLTVVDVDDPFTFARWGWKIPDGPLPDVPQVRTLKGMHYFFKASPEDHCGSIYYENQPVGDFLTPTPPAWREWDRAYVVAPPSLHPDLPFRYEWAVSLADRPLIPVPAWIRAAVVEPIEPHSWYAYDDEDDDEEDDYRRDCPYCGGEFWDGGTSCTCGDDYDLNTLVQDLLEKRYPGGPPENLDWGGLYADAYEESARRAAVGTPCPKCGAPLPTDRLCPCETYQELPEDEC